MLLNSRLAFTISHTHTHTYIHACPKKTRIIHFHIYLWPPPLKIKTNTTSWQTCMVAPPQHRRRLHRLSPAILYRRRTPSPDSSCRLSPSLLDAPNPKLSPLLPLQSFHFLTRPPPGSSANSARPPPNSVSSNSPITASHLNSLTQLNRKLSPSSTSLETRKSPAFP